MADRMSGVVTIVQESRFQLTDDAGVGHFFMLAPGAAAEPAQLAGLQARQARVCVRYTPLGNAIGNLAADIFLEPQR